jgi:hypothetical protein
MTHGASCSIGSISSMGSISSIGGVSGIGTRVGLQRQHLCRFVALLVFFFLSLFSIESTRRDQLMLETSRDTFLDRQADPLMCAGDNNDVNVLGADEGGGGEDDAAMVR